MNQPRVAEQYLQAAAAIDIHNHNLSGSVGLEDVWHTKNPRQRQLAGIRGFCFTNGFLAMKYFRQKPQAPHIQDGSSSNIDQLPSYKPLKNRATRKIINH